MSLGNLRSRGAQHLDPVRFRYLEVLEQRLCAQRGAVRQILQTKFQNALTDYLERLEHARTAAGTPRARPQGVRAAPRLLADLNRYIQAQTQENVEPGLHGESGSGAELKSVRHFKQAWSMMHAQDQVERAIEHGPENAGPLNSHRLVLGSVALMRELSPHYLQRFLAHVDSLLWLDRADLSPKPPETKSAARSGRKK